MAQYSVRRAKIGRTAQFDTLSHASGQVYSQTLVCFWHIMRHKGTWLSPGT